MSDLECLALAIWRQCLPKIPDLSWEDMHPNEHRVALSMARAAVFELFNLIARRQNPTRILALPADKILAELSS